MVKIVYNSLLRGWLVVRGPHHAPLSGRFDSRDAAAQWLAQRGTVPQAPTIWEDLVAKLGREPTSAECREECQRIIREAQKETAP